MLSGVLGNVGHHIMWGSQSGQGRQQVGGLANYEVTMATNVCFQAAPTKLVEEGRTHIGCSFEIRSFAFFDVRHLWTWVSSIYTLTHFRLHWCARPPIIVWLRVRSGSTIYFEIVRQKNLVFQFNWTICLDREHFPAWPNGTLAHDTLYMAQLHMAQWQKERGRPRHNT